MVAFDDRLYIVTNQGNFICNIKAFSYETFDASRRFTNIFICNGFIICVSNDHGSLCVYTKYGEFICQILPLENCKIVKNIIYWNGKIYVLKRKQIMVAEMNEDGEYKKYIKTIHFTQCKISSVCYEHEFIYIGTRNGSIIVYNMDKESFMEDRFLIDYHKSRITSMTINNSFLYSIDFNGVLCKWTLMGKLVKSITTTRRLKHDPKLITNGSVINLICQYHTKIFDLNLVRIKTIRSTKISNDGIKCNGCNGRTRFNNIMSTSYNSKIYMVESNGIMTEYGELFQHMLGRLAEPERDLISSWQSTWRRVGIQKDLSFLFIRALLE